MDASLGGAEVGGAEASLAGGAEASFGIVPTYEPTTFTGSRSESVCIFLLVPFLNSFVRGKEFSGLELSIPSFRYAPLSLAPALSPPARYVFSCRNWSERGEGKGGKGGTCVKTMNWLSFSFFGRKLH